MDFKPDLMRQGSIETRPMRREFVKVMLCTGSLTFIALFGFGIHQGVEDSKWTVFIVAMLLLIPLVLCGLQMYLQVGLFQGERRNPGAVRMSFIKNHAPKKLVNAAKNGDLTLAQKLLNQGANINAKVNTGKTPLMAAAEEGEQNMVALLIQNNARLNEKNSLGKTALIIAVSLGNTGCVKELIDGGADLEAADNHGRTALWWARSANDHKAAKYLLSKGARDPEDDDRVETSIGGKTMEVGNAAIEVNADDQKAEVPNAERKASAHGTRAII